ncbi:peptidylprolyl isomerase [Paucibacter sp. AS339]|uniref:peptidylprolyl isomerase n=1 Tax=Paucibacter hankyongi TaxID=3133434 RepID=UPI0030A57748
MGQHGCGGGSCGCSGGAESLSVDPLKAPELQQAIASVNGVPLHGVGEYLDAEALRQRACSELLRQAAQRGGLLSVGDVPALDGVISEAASEATLALLERELKLPEPDEPACRRYFEAHPARFRQGERVQARHILFAVTPGVDVAALRQRAEALLVSLRCEALDSPAFAQAASTHSNCPSGAEGGDLGWLLATDCAPEFGSALFAQDEANAHIGVLPRLVSTRFGFHIVQVLAREPGVAQAFEAVMGSIAQLLHQQAYMTALRQYLSLLAGQAKLVGVEMDVADSPLLQ